MATSRLPCPHCGADIPVRWHECLPRRYRPFTWTCAQCGRDARVPAWRGLLGVVLGVCAMVGVLQLAKLLEPACATAEYFAICSFAPMAVATVATLAFMLAYLAVSWFTLEEFARA